MYRYLGSLLLGAALIAPVGIRANNNPGDDRREDARERRYYDRDHRDYHLWDDREDGRYRHWRAERHEAYRPFYKVKRAQQRAYWKWRHEHPDNRYRH
jgi:hypothetical protein